MQGRVIEVLSRGTRLRRERGFLCVLPQTGEGAKIPLTDIACLMLGQDVTITGHTLLALQDAGAIVVVCGSDYHPASFFWPMSVHNLHCQRLEAQIQATIPTQKRLWQAVVQAKIRNQARVLEVCTKQPHGLWALAERVRSGDPDNLEAQAAQRYWPQLLGQGFRRRPAGMGASVPDPNIFLNYGYAVIRAGMARAISAAGLHPTLGIFHTNQANTFRLVDDLMEPYRPYVDLYVHRLFAEDAPPTALDPAHKKLLAAVLEHETTNSAGENSPLMQTMQDVAVTFCRGLTTGDVSLFYPCVS